MVEILASLDELSFDGPTPFATKAWLAAALKADESARVLVWKDERNLEAQVVAPFAIDGAGCLKFIGQDKADLNEVMVKGPAQNHYWAWKEICEAILAMKEVKRVCFEKLPATSPFAAYMAATLKGALLFRAVGHSRVNATLVHLKQKDRSRIKALLAENGKLEMIDAASASLDEAWRTLDELAGKMVADKKRRRAFWGERERSIVKAMWVAKLAEVALLKDDGGIPKAAAIRFLKDKTAWCWMAFYADGKYLTELYAKYIAEVAKRGEDWIIDFGSGTYGWKLGTFRPEICPCVTLRWSRSWRGRLGDWLRMLVRYARV